jgi:hypothetical protein
MASSTELEICTREGFCGVCVCVLISLTMGEFVPVFLRGYTTSARLWRMWAAGTDFSRYTNRPIVDLKVKRGILKAPNGEIPASSGSRHR